VQFLLYLSKTPYECVACHVQMYASSQEWKLSWWNFCPWKSWKYLLHIWIKLKSRKWSLTKIVPEWQKYLFWLWRIKIQPLDLLCRWLPLYSLSDLLVARERTPFCACEFKEVLQLVLQQNDVEFTDWLLEQGSKQSQIKDNRPK